VGPSLAEYYLMTWRTLRGLGSSHHGAGEKSLTKRTHMSVPLRVDEEEGRAQQQSGESASSLLVAKRNLGACPRIRVRNPQVLVIKQLASFEPN